MRREVVHEQHGDRRGDAYAWLRGTSDPEAVAYLEAERAYYDSVSRSLRAEVDALAEEMSSRVAPSEVSVASYRERFAYLARTPERAEYEQLCRTHHVEGGSVDTSEMTVLLDPATLIGQSAYVDLGLTLVSPDERLLAYSVDTTGDEVFTLRFRDLESGDDLSDVVPRSYYGGAWSADSTAFFYTVHDEKYRPHEVWLHRLGSDVGTDRRVHTEEDERFELELRACRSGDMVEIAALSRDTTEVWLVDAHDPASPPRCVEPRRHGVEYRVEHARTPAGDRLFITTNDGATQYRLMSAPLARPGRTGWVEVVAEEPAERLHEATAFAGHIVTTLRRDARLMARAYPIGAGGDLIGPGVDIAASVAVGTLELARNDWYDADHVQVVEQSYSSPPAWYSVDLATGQRTLLKTQDVPNFEADRYVSERATAPVPGVGIGPGRTGIPVTLVRRSDTPLDGSAPCLLYGYGAYEACFEPEFDPALISLLDRGVVFAHAHVRGGGEGGRRWWLDGRLEHKQNTFSDHIAVADHLAQGLVDGQRIVTRGLSAGGLLQGAVFSQAPARWRAVIAEVPFVDVVTTMLDASIPLTVTEWDEWGDPRRQADYAWMKAYSPYDNVPAAGRRPDLLVTGALHDPRVLVFEPAKWVAALRHSDPAWSPRCLFRVELGEGAHVGPSGRYAHLRYEAEIYAWLLDRVNADPFEQPARADQGLTTRTSADRSGSGLT